MAIEKQLHTIEEFDEFIARPENADRMFEFIDGEIIEVPSNAYSSEIAIFIAAALLWFLRGKNWGHVTGEHGGYIVGGYRCAPDVAYISRERQPKLARKGYNPNPPHFVVEVMSPTDTDKDTAKAFAKKLKRYDEAGVFVWVVHPEEQRVEIRAPGQPVQIANIDDVIDAGEALPGFSMAVRDFLPEE
ncbi:MAG: Uma2 family endonuclease [Burkholderiales bacterium]|nr:Uma2 family endonuclease [Anaerolineae bacterium]